MTNEEIQRVMEFIIKQQESFAEGMEQMRDSHAKAEVRISRLETATVQLYTATIELTKKMTELAEAQAHTDRRLDALIDIIEQGRNGKSQG